jgi:hypothetical protein
MKKTAVEWLVEQYLKRKGFLKTSDIEQAKEMEKEQMMQCYEDGYNRVVKLIEDATQRNFNL